jgi:hypothetical protein
MYPQMNALTDQLSSLLIEAYIGFKNGIQTNVTHATNQLGIMLQNMDDVTTAVCKQVVRKFIIDSNSHSELLIRILFLISLFQCNVNNVNILFIVTQIFNDILSTQTEVNTELLPHITYVRHLLHNNLDIVNSFHHIDDMVDTQAHISLNEYSYNPQNYKCPYCRHIFQNETVHQSQEIDGLTCTACLDIVEYDKIYYALPCRHVLCSDCFWKIGGNDCNISKDLDHNIYVDDELWHIKKLT